MVGFKVEVGLRCSKPKPKILANLVREAYLNYSLPYLFLLQVGQRRAVPGTPHLQGRVSDRNSVGIDHVLYVVSASEM